MIGESRPRTGLARLREPLPQRLMRATPPGVDVRIVADRGREEEAGMIEHVLVGVALVLSASPAGYLLARSRLRGRRARTRHGRCGASCCRSPAPRSHGGRLDAALRLARAENATLMPAYLAAVPMRLPLDCAIPAEAAQGDADARGDRTAGGRPGRSGRRPDRARPLLPARAEPPARQEQFDRVVVPATAAGRAGLSGEDLVWLLEQSARRGTDPAPGAERREPPLCDPRMSGHRRPLVTCDPYPA